MTEMLHICYHRQEPGERECRTAVWSVGRACKSCPVASCYRQGWKKSSVDADNLAFVRRKREAILRERREE